MLLKILAFSSFGAMEFFHSIVSISVTIKLEKAVSKRRPVPRLSYLQTNCHFSDLLQIYFRSTSDLHHIIYF